MSAGGSEPGKAHPRDGESSNGAHSDGALSGGPGADGPRRKPRSHRARRVLLGAAVAVGLVALAWLLRNRVVAPLLLDALRGSIAERTGYELHVAQFGGNWTSEIEFGGVRIEARDAHGELRSASARVVALELDSWAALRGAAGALKRIEVRDAQIEVDLSAPARDAGDPWSPDSLETWPSVVAANVSARVRLDSTRTLAVERANGRLASSLSKARQAPWELDLPRFALEGDWPLRAREFALRGNGLFHGGSVEVQVLESSGDIELREARGALDLSALPRGELTWKLECVAVDGDLAFDARHSEGEFTLRFDAREVQLGRVLETFTPEREDLDWGTATLAGELQVGNDGLWLWTRGGLRNACFAARPVQALEVEAALTPRELWVASCDARLGGNRLLARHIRVPRGGTDWTQTLRESRGWIEVDANDVPTLLGADPDLAPRHAFDLVGELDESGLELRTGALRTLGGALWLDRGSVRWGEAHRHWLDDAALDLQLRAKFSDLGQLGALVGDLRWTGSATGAVRVRGRVGDPSGVLDLVGASVTIGDLPLGEVAARLRLSAGRLAVERLRSDGELGALQLTGDFDLRDKLIREADFKLDTADGVALAHTLGLFDASPYVASGALSVSGGCSGPLLDPDGALELRASDVLTSEGRVFESLTLRVRRERESWTLDELSVRSGSYAASVAGVAEADWRRRLGFARITSAVLRYAHAELLLTLPGTFSFGPEQLTTSWFELAGNAGSARLRVHAAPDDVRVELHAGGLDPLALAAPLLPSDAEFGAAGGELELVRSGDGWSARADFELQDARWGVGWPLADLEVAGHATEQTLELRRFRLEGGEAGRVELSGVARRAVDGPFVFEALGGEARGVLEGLELAVWPWRRLGSDFELSGRVDANFDFDFARGAPRGRLRLDAVDLAAHFFDDRLGAAEGELTPVRVSIDARLGDELAIERFELDAPERVHVSVSGSFGGASSWIAAAGARALPADEPVALRASWNIDDLRWLAAFSPLIRRVEGAASGDIALGGTWGRPRANGSWLWTRGALRLGVDAPPFERIEARGTLVGSRIELEQLSGELGAGPFQISGAVELAEGGSFDLALHGRELLVLRERDLRARANVDLRLTGPFSAPLLSGTVGARDGRWRQRIEWLPSAPAPVVARRGGELPFTLRDSVLERLRYDIAIDSAGAFVIDTNLAKINVRPALRLGGRADAPTLEGAIFLDPTRVTLPGSTLDLRAGSLLFDAYSPTTPHVDVTATTRVLGYDITARLTGRTDALERELTSTPPLRSEDISVLLLTGRAPRDVLSNESSVDAAQTVILFLGKDLLSSWFGDAGELTERFEWRAGTDATRTGGSTAQVSVRLAGPATGTGSALYLRGENDIYDRINYGVRWVVRFK